MVYRTPPAERSALEIRRTDLDLDLTRLGNIVLRRHREVRQSRGRIKVQRVEETPLGQCLPSPQWPPAGEGPLAGELGA